MVLCAVVLSGAMISVLISAEVIHTEDLSPEMWTAPKLSGVFGLVKWIWLQAKNWISSKHWQRSLCRIALGKKCKFKLRTRSGALALLFVYALVYSKNTWWSLRDEKLASSSASRLSPPHRRLRHQELPLWHGTLGLRLTWLPVRRWCDACDAEVSPSGFAFTTPALEGKDFLTCYWQEKAQWNINASHEAKPPGPGCFVLGCGTVSPSDAQLCLVTVYSCC